MSQGTQVPLEAEKNKDTVPLRASRENLPCGHLDFNPVKLNLDF